MNNQLAIATYVSAQSKWILDALKADSCACGRGVTLGVSLAYEGSGVLVAAELAFHDEEPAVIDTLTHSDRISVHAATRLIQKVGPLALREAGRYGGSGFRCSFEMEALFSDMFPTDASELISEFTKAL